MRAAASTAAGVCLALLFAAARGQVTPTPADGQTFAPEEVNRNTLTATYMVLALIGAIGVIVVCTLCCVLQPSEPEEEAGNASGPVVVEMDQLPTGRDKSVEPSEPSSRRAWEDGNMTVTTAPTKTPPDSDRAGDLAASSGIARGETSGRDERHGETLPHSPGARSRDADDMKVVDDVDDEVSI